MHGDLVDPAHHVARQVPKSRAPNGIPQASEFVLREGEADFSVNCLELTSDAPDRLTQLRAVRAALIASHRTVPDNHWFAVLQTADITAITELRGVALALTVIQTPIPTNSGHSSIFGLPPFGTELANLAGLELVRAIKEPAIRAGTL